MLKRDQYLRVEDHVMHATMLSIAALFAGTALAQPNVTAWNVLTDGFNDKKLERRQ
jgi:hypothetical protein